MGIVTQILAGKGDISLSQLDTWMDQAVSGVPTLAGADVNEENSLNLIPVFACVRLIANTIATLPFPVYLYTTGGGKRRDWEHPLYPILHDSPNPEMTAFDFWAAIVSHLERWGNGYAEIERGYTGQVRALWPLDPARIAPDHWGEDGRVIYKLRLPSGEPKYLHSSLVLHIRGFGSNGITGYGPIALARQGIGLAKALESYGATFFGNDSRPGGVLSVEGVLKKEGRDALKDAWEDAHRGLSQKHRIAVLDAGAKFQATSLPNEDSQFLESRKFQTGEIATLFGVPPHMIGDTDRSTSWGTGIEQQTTGWYITGLRARVVMIEQRVALDLFTPEERRTHKAEFIVDGLLRGDASTRHETYQKGVQNGYYSINDVLRLENRNPIGPEGDRRFVNGNMRPIDELYTTGPRGGLPQGRMHEIVREAAARVVRKEIVAMGKAERRYEGQPEALLAAIEEFYSEHGQYIAESLRVNEEATAVYVVAQKAMMLAGGSVALMAASVNGTDYLVNLALGGNDA